MYHGRSSGGGTGGMSGGRRSTNPNTSNRRNRVTRTGNSQSPSPQQQTRRNNLQMGGQRTSQPTHTMPDGTVMPGAFHGAPSPGGSRRQSPSLPRRRRVNSNSTTRRQANSNSTTRRRVNPRPTVSRYSLMDGTFYNGLVLSVGDKMYTTTSGAYEGSSREVMINNSNKI
jgi:hypothetical protein